MMSERKQGFSISLRRRRESWRWLLPVSADLFVERAESASDGLMIGHVSLLADECDSEITEEHGELLKVLIELMKHPLVQELKLDVDLTKAQSVSYRLSDLLPVAPEEKQKLLEIDSAEERLSRLRKIIDKFHN